jgi:fatty acid desaturase
VSIFAVANLLGVPVQRVARRPAPQAALARIERLAERVAPALLRDPRNAPFLPRLVASGLWGPLVWAASLAWLAQRGEFAWTAAWLHHLVLWGPSTFFLSWFVPLQHQQGHQKRGFFQERWRVLDAYIGWPLAMIYGFVPRYARNAHIGGHHRHDGDLDDPQTCAHLDRRRPAHFLGHVAQLAGVLSGASILVFELRRRRWRDAARVAAGMTAFYGAAALLALWDPRIPLAYVILPQLAVVHMLASVNYGQHGFLDPDQPGNVYRNTTTIEEGPDNPFWEDYHLAHHLRPQANWVDWPKIHEAYVGRMLEEDALVFRGTTYTELTVLLLLRRWDRIADLMIDPRGRSKEERIRLIEHRLRPAKALTPAA